MARVEAVEALERAETLDASTDRLSRLMMELATEGIEHLLSNGAQTMTASELLRLGEIAHKLRSLDEGRPTARVDVPGLADEFRDVDIDALWDDEIVT